MNAVLNWASIFAAALSAGCGLYAGFFLPLRDNIDKIYADLALQSQWTAYAAAAAGVAVLLQAVSTYLAK